jgi:CRISPR-associated protein Cmr2
MSNFDFFADNAKIFIRADNYTGLLLEHAKACRAGDPARKKAARIRTNLDHFRPGPNHVDLMCELGITDVRSGVIETLPAGAVFISFDFWLAKKYVSRDDAVFFPIDNPLRRDHVFKVPMVAAATWKGSLRAACVEMLVFGEKGRQADGRLTMLDLFGDEKSVDGETDLEEAKKLHKLEYFLDQHLAGSEEFHKARRRRASELGLRPDELHQRGRLHFFPSWFEKTDFDVLNPRDKVKRTGTVPITIEVVPAGAKSSFSLLYFPFDLLGQAEKIPEAQRRDWNLIGPALLHMLTSSGFGAKKSSGCGRVSPNINNFQMRCKSDAFQKPTVSLTQQFSELGKAFAGAPK